MHHKDKISQPPTEMLLISVKNWIFDDLFPKKGPLLVILVPGMIQLSGSVIFLMKWGCKGHWGHGGCWGCRGHWGCRCSKVWKITTSELSRFLNSALLWCFEKNIVLVESWNILLKFITFSIGGCWEQTMLLFWKLVDETQMPTTHEATRHHNSK